MHLMQYQKVKGIIFEKYIKSLLNPFWVRVYMYFNLYVILLKKLENLKNIFIQSGIFFYFKLLIKSYSTKSF